MYQTLHIQIDDSVAHVRINRPDKANAFNQDFWEEFKTIMEALDEQKEVRVIVLSAEGKNFSAGMDLTLLMQAKQTVETEYCPAKGREQLRKDILAWQAAITAIEHCKKPVLAAIHGACMGAGVDLVTACDMRYCTDDVQFSVKEVDLGIVADLGTLQRLIRVIPYGIALEMALSAKIVDGKEAERIHLVNRSYKDQATMLREVTKFAKLIASKSPLAVRGTKQVVLHARDHTVADGLAYVANWNAATLISKDVEVAMNAQMNRETPTFGD
ncbi:MAG: crotonase/enoyl-CoA hydratase family protein [Thermonemataceae bacterium]